MQDPVFVCVHSVVRKRGVMRARDSLKPGLGSRLPNKALFYYKHYVCIQFIFSPSKSDYPYCIVSKFYIIQNSRVNYQQDVNKRTSLGIARHMFLTKELIFDSKISIVCTPTPWLTLLLVLGKSRVKQNSC